MGVCAPTARRNRLSAWCVGRTALLLVLLASMAGCRTAIDPLAIADAQTAARVKTTLVNDPDLGPRTIEVRVVGGVVELSGRVLTPEEAARAAALAAAVPGVASVRQNLQVGGVETQGLDEQPVSGGASDVSSSELQDNPGLLALGGAITWSTPRSSALETRVAISPLIKIGSGRGFGWTVGLGWFQTDVGSLSERSDALTRVYVKPVMFGAGYTVGSERVSLTTSLVGGYAWNSLTVTDTGLAAGLPVEVSNSLVWRPGVSMWYDVGRKTALNLSIGHVVTRLRLTVLDNGRLQRRSADGDTTIVHAGVAYKLF